jgi:hypothetical protein
LREGAVSLLCSRKTMSANCVELDPDASLAQARAQTNSLAVADPEKFSHQKFNELLGLILMV